MKKYFALAIAFFGCLCSLTAQKAYISAYSGEVAVLRVNGKLLACQPYLAVAFGDLVVTGPSGTATIFVPGRESVDLAEDSALGFFSRGPGTAPEAYFSLIAGSATSSAFSENSNEGIFVDDEPIALSSKQEKYSAQLARLRDGAGEKETRASLAEARAALERHAAKRAALETSYADATAALLAANEEYAKLLVAGNVTALRPFESATLFPAQDRRSAIIADIRYRNVSSFAIRRFILSPLYMRAKTRFRNDALAAEIAEISRSFEIPAEGSNAAP